MGDPVCQGSCLRWFVRATETAPNAPNALPLASVGSPIPFFKVGIVSLQLVIGLQIGQCGLEVRGRPP